MIASPSADALSPLLVTLRALTVRQGLADPLQVVDRDGWFPATDLVNGSRLTEMLDCARDKWDAAPHASAALAWKAYAYWLALPAVLSWATARRVPLVEPEDVLVRLVCDAPLLQVGLANPRVMVLADDPLAETESDSIAVAADEAALLSALRGSLLDRHLDPLADQIYNQVKVGKHTLNGSVASGIAYAVIRTAKALPESPATIINTLLDALDLSHLIELTPGSGGLPGVQRKTCCLAFTLPEPRICSGCCLPGARLNR